MLQKKVSAAASSLPVLTDCAKPSGFVSSNSDAANQALYVAPKPPIKWVGGKRQLLDELTPRLPANINTYFEPFIGGGALMWSMDKKAVKATVINDFNPELTNLYRVIKEQPYALIEDLKTHRNDKDYFYALRNVDRTPALLDMSNVERASRFIYINKTGFNGLYRVNAKGQVNTSFGGYENPCILDESNILACSAALQDVEILNGDFEGIKAMICAGDFVYLDPPYAPLSDTANFVGYTKLGFSDDMQMRLKAFCDYIDSVGAHFMMSNSSAPLIYDLYADYRIDEVMASRAVNCKAQGRGKVVELVVRNYR